MSAATGYLELGMFDDAANALEEIEPEDKTRTEVLGARIDLYLAAEKWEMAAAVAARLVKIQPENASWWIKLARATRRFEGIEEAREILLQASELHHGSAAIEFNLACYESLAGHFEAAKGRLQRAIELDQERRRVALEDPDLEPLWNWIGGLKE